MHPLSKGLYIVAGSLAVAALLLGIYEVFIERNTEQGVVRQLVVPLALLFVVLALYRKRSRDATKKA